MGSHIGQGEFLNMIDSLFYDLGIRVLVQNRL